METMPLDPVERPDLMNPAVREQLLEEHPMIRKPYTVLTPMMENTYRIMRERVWLRRTGSYMYSQPRMGKSTCADMISELLVKEFPGILLAKMSADGGKGEVNMLFDVATALNIMVRGRRNHSELVTKIVVFIQSEVELRKGNQFVLVVDEMQFLREADYRVLLNIHNRLGMCGILMTTLGFAQPEINEQRSALLATSSQHIIARFLSEPIQFSGCTSSDGLRFILKGYDESKAFPLGTKWTYTRFFLPEAYGAGFRLSTYTDFIWKALSSAASALGAGSVPMEHLTRVIESILLASRLQDSPYFVLSVDDIDSAVNSSNLLIYSKSLNNGQ